jgi:hypothetical protein
MKTPDFNSAVTSFSLNESMFKKFGTRINFDKYTREQLEDARNQLRTKLSQTETSAGFNELLANEGYQKEKYMLTLLNTRIKEMLGEMKAMDPPLSAHTDKPDLIDKSRPLDPRSYEYKRTYKAPLGTKASREAHAVAADVAKSNTGRGGNSSISQIKKGAKTQTKPLTGYLNQRPPRSEGTEQSSDKYSKTTTESTKMKNKKKPAKLKRIKSKKGIPSADLVSESSARRRNYGIIIEGLKRFIAEDEEGKAKDITAGTDMVKDFTGWMQRVGQYQTKSMIELADSIRANFGQAEADTFKNTIQPALQQALEALTQSRETVTQAVAVLAGEGTAETPMGAAPEGDLPGVDTSPDTMNLAPDLGAGDEFAASDAAAGGSETAGREMREGREMARARKLAEAHSIMSKLAR